MRGRQPASGPVALLVHAFLPVPPSWHWKRKQAALAGVELPIGKPDYDNFVKGPADAMREIVYLDDAQVVDGRCIKRYSATPALRVEVREFVAPVVPERHDHASVELSAAPETKKPAEEAGLEVGQGRLYRG